MLTADRQPMPGPAGAAVKGLPCIALDVVTFRSRRRHWRARERQP